MSGTTWTNSRDDMVPPVSGWAVPAYSSLNMLRKHPQAEPPAATVCPASQRHRVLLERAADPLHTPREASTDSFRHHRPSNSANTFII
jgi:hypothetical protein